MINEKTADILVEACRKDGEFRLAARHWTGSLRLEAPGSACVVRLENGEFVAAPSPSDDKVAIVLAASEATWVKLLSPSHRAFTTTSPS